MSNQDARLLRARLGWVNRIRPMALAAWLANVVGPERRTIVQTSAGAKYFVDPLSLLGQSLVDDGCYEPETEAIFRKHLSEGGHFLDVGANEGYFTVLAASIVGPLGYVASVEPQSRLAEIIQVNLSLNGLQANIFRGALGGQKGSSHELYLSPALNNGYSSLLKRPRFTRRSETITFVDPMALMQGEDGFALAKVDVEGFESEVVQSLLPLMERGKIRALLLDYHASILESRGIVPADIERKILGAGMILKGEPTGYSGFRLYARN
jgi:FkbM family methyltransferase